LLAHEHTAHEIKQAQQGHPLHELIAARWSPRAYAPTPVAADDLRSLFEAARWAASSGNGQPWSFVVATQEQPEIFARLVDCLNDGNVPWASRAPVLGIVVTQTVRANGRANRTAFYDAGLAMQNLAIQATANGLALRQMGGFSPDKARELFAIPEGYEPIVMFALGYPGDPAALGDNHREQELSPRQRRPIQEFVFGATWGETSALVTEEDSA
jgi:nitroreductase